MKILSQIQQGENQTQEEFDIMTSYIDSIGESK